MSHLPQLKIWQLSGKIRPYCFSAFVALLLALCLPLSAIAQANGTDTSLPQSASQGESTEAQVGEVVVVSENVTAQGINTVIEVPVLKDAYIASNQPDVNFGLSPEIRLGYNLNGDGALRPLVQFGLTSIPSGATINSAKLRLYLFALTPNGDGDMGYEARHLATSWTESLVTWNLHQPQWGSVFARGGARGAPLGWKEQDVTALVRDWYLGAQPNNGFIVIGDERQDQERQRFYYSKDAGNGLYPRLIVDYTVAPSDTTPPTASVNPLPTWSQEDFVVSWSGQDNDGGSGIDHYDLQYNSNGGPWVDWKLRTKETEATWRGGRNGDTYQFRVRAVDRAGNRQEWTGSQAQTRIDSEPPIVSVNQLPEITTSSSALISWTGNDGSGSGIATYDVEIRIGDGGWQALVSQTPQTSFFATGGQNGVTYEFRARGTDNVGNTGPFPPAGQAQTTVALEPLSIVLPFDPPILNATATVTDSFDVQWIGFTAPGTSITAYELRYRFTPQGSATSGSWTNVPLPSPTAQSLTFNLPSQDDGAYAFEVRAINSIGQSQPFTGVAQASKIVDLVEPFIVPSYWMPFVPQD